MNDEFTQFTGQGDHPGRAPMKGLVSERWELLSRIGEGGMSEVYKARHVLMNKIGAVKFLKGNLSTDPIAVKRFQQEALTSGTLDHPNIVQTYDCGVCEQGFYLILEFLEGVSLADILDERAAAAADGRGVLTPEEAVPIFMEICDGLEHAHRKGIVHRDIKPSNVMLTRSNALRPDKQTVKLVDFGIAKILASDGSASAADHSLTRTGEVFGSPLYMSPEQCMGKGIDGRSDMYSVACLMYETLVGRKAIIGKNPTETMMMHVHEAPDTSLLDRLDHPGAAVLKAIIDCCLNKSPEDRFASMAELKAALAEVPLLDDEPSEREDPGKVKVVLLLTGVAVLLLMAMSLATYSLLPVTALDLPLPLEPPPTQLERLLSSKLSGEKIEKYRRQAKSHRELSSYLSTRPVLDKIKYDFVEAKLDVLCGQFKEAKDALKDVTACIHDSEVATNKAFPDERSILAQAGLGQAIVNYLTRPGSDSSLVEADYDVQTVLHEYGSGQSELVSRLIYEWQARIKLKNKSFREAQTAIAEMFKYWPAVAPEKSELADLEREAADNAAAAGENRGLIFLPIDEPTLERRALWQASLGDLLRVNQAHKEACDELSKAIDNLEKLNFSDKAMLGQMYYRLGLAQLGQENKAAFDSFKTAAGLFENDNEKMHQAALAQAYMALKKSDWLGALFFRFQNGV